MDVLYLRVALDPEITFGITAPEVDAKDLILSSHMECGTGHWWLSFAGLLDRLAKRELTGNAALEAAINVLFEAPSALDLKWARRILDRNLRAGIDITTLNKIFPGTIEKHAVMKGDPYDPDKHELTGAWFVEPKLDGLRMTVIDGTPWTTGHKEFQTVGHILRELRKLPSPWVFDGELIGEEDFDSNSGAARRISTGTDDSQVFHVFDLVRREEWRSRATRPLAERKDDMRRLLGDFPSNCVRVVPWTRIVDPTGRDLKKIRDDLIAMGHEGAMLKRAASPYEWKRSHNVLKFKEFVDADGTIADFKEGKGKHRGSLGAIYVEGTEAAGPNAFARTKVGSGFTDAERDAIWADRASYLGRVVEIQYQNKIEKTGKLRFPTFVRFRPDKD